MQLTINSRAWVVAGLLGLALLGGLITGQRVFSDLAWMFMVLLVVALLWALSTLFGVRISRRVRSRRSQVGRIFEERLNVVNTSRFPKLWVELYDESDLPHHNVSQVIAQLGGKQQQSWSVRTLCVRRGRFRLGPAILRAGDPFGMFSVRRELPIVTHMVVYPAVYDIESFVIPIGSAPGGDALRRRTPFVTPNASGVRDYQVGDSLSRIHWKSSARRDRLMVKEFELDPLGDVWVILDGFARDHYIPDDAEEILTRAHEEFWAREQKIRLPGDTASYAISAAASLAQYFLRRERPVGVIAYGNVRETIAPDSGERQLTRILETLAMFQAEGQLSLEDVLGQELHNFQRGATVLLITPSHEDRWLNVALTLRRRGLKVAVVVINRGSFGGSANVGHAETIGTSAQMPVTVIREGDDIGVVLGISAARLPASTLRAMQ